MRPRRCRIADGGGHNVCIVFTLHGSESSATQAPIDPQLKADILGLLEVTHAVERAETGIRMAFDSMRPHLLTAIPSTPNRDRILAEYGDRLAALPGSQEFLDGIVRVYAKYYSDEDVNALAEFYAHARRTTFNQHSVDVQTDSMKFGQQFAASRLSQISADICEEYSELQGQAKFCDTGNKKAEINSSSQ